MTSLLLQYLRVFGDGLLIIAVGHTLTQSSHHVHIMFDIIIVDVSERMAIWRSSRLGERGSKKMPVSACRSHFVHKTDSELLVKAVGTTGSVAPDLFKSIAVVVIIILLSCCLHLPHLLSFII